MQGEIKEEVVSKRKQAAALQCQQDTALLCHLYCIVWRVPSSWHYCVTYSGQFGEFSIHSIIVLQRSGSAGIPGCSTSEFQKSENLGRKKWYVT